MAELRRGQHMIDFLERRADQEHAAEEHDQAVAVESPRDHWRKSDAEKWILQGADQLQHDEKQNDAQPDGKHDADLAHIFLLVGRNPLGLDRYIEEIVEAKHRL